MSSTLDSEFEAFYGKIELGKRQNERIESAADALSTYLCREYELDDQQVFLQGSYPNGTAVKPDPDRAGGEYDVDLIAECADPNATEDGALDDLRETLEANGNYADKIAPKSPNAPCVRLEYADDAIGAFHVDVVPAREADAAPLEVPRRDCGWRETAPAEYTFWAQDQGEGVTRTVQMLKRWRDHHHAARKSVKSIVLQVLAADHRHDASTDAERVAGTLRNVADFLNQSSSSAPEIKNPVLTSENLADGWSDSDYQNFVHAVNDAANVAESALTAATEDRAKELWQGLFGSDFPGSDSERGPYTPPPNPTTEPKKRQKVPPVEWG